MGFDNECILNIQSLAGEYFCPVCRTLVYPNEALQAQCTHLYCKPCLAYIVSSTQACPYDGYLVTEAGSKPVTETNKALAETIGKVPVHCLYHRSGCTWQGSLSECTSHCSGCTFGNSPVVCNRCGLQIVHRQVQEHAQTCNVNGANAQTQPGTASVQDSSTSGAVVASDQKKSGTQPGVQNSQASAPQTVAIPPPVQNPNQQGSANPQSQAVAPNAVPTPEQWYQYQQYYQQYPGYDPYQQAFQQYYPYQPQAAPHIQQHPPLVQGQPHPQLQPSQPLAQAQSQAQVQPQPQNQLPPQSHLQAQNVPHGQPQPHPYPQAPTSQSQNQAQANQPQHLHPVQSHAQVQAQPQGPHPPPPPPHGLLPPQPYPQAQPHSVQTHPQQHMQGPQVHYQQAHPQIHPQAPLLPHPHAQGHPQAQYLSHPQPHPQPHPPQANQPPTPNAPPPNQHSSIQTVTGHHSYKQPQGHQQMQQAPPQQHMMHIQPSGGSLPPTQVQSQFPQPPAHMRAPQPHVFPPNQQPPALLPSQGQASNIPSAQQQIIPNNQQTGPSIHQRPVMQPQQHMPQQYVQQAPPFAGQVSAQIQNPLHPGHFPQQQPQLRPQGPPQAMQQHPPPYIQPQQNVAVVHGMQPHQSQSHVARPVMPNHGVQLQQFPQSTGAFGGPPQLRPPHGSNQLSATPSYVNTTNNQLQTSSEQLSVQSGFLANAKMVERKGDQTSERTVEHKDAGSPSQKSLEKDVIGVGAGLAKGNTDQGMKSVGDEHKPSSEGDDSHKHEERKLKDASEGFQGNDAAADPLIRQRLNEEGKEGTLEPSAEGVKPGDSQATAPSQKQADKNVVNASSQSSTERNKAGGSHAVNSSDHLHHGPVGDESGGFQGKGFEQSSHPSQFTDHGRRQLPPMPYGPSAHQQRPSVPSMSQAAPPTGPPSEGHLQGHIPLGPLGPGHMPQPGQVLQQPPALKQPGSFHPDNSLGGFPEPGSTASYGRGPGQFPNAQRSFEIAPPGQFNQGPITSSHPGHSRMSQGEPVGPPMGGVPPGSFESHDRSMGRAPPLRGPEGHSGPPHPIPPMDGDMFSNHRPPHFDSRRSDSHLPGSLEKGPFGQPFGSESNPMGMNGAASGMRDERFKAIEERPNPFPRSSHMGGEASPKFGNNFLSSRPMDRGPPVLGMDGSHRNHDKGSHGSNYDAGRNMEPGARGGFLPPYRPGVLHPNESGERGRPVGNYDDNRGRADSGRSNPDFLGPDPGFNRHHMDGFPPRSPGREYLGNQSRPFGGFPGGINDIDGRETHPFGERPGSFNLPSDSGGHSLHENRFPMMPPAHMRRREFEGPGNLQMGEHMRSGDLVGQDVPPHMRRGELFNPRNISGHPPSGEPGFGSFGYGRIGELAGPGGFPHRPFGEPFGKSGHPRLGEPGFRSSYTLQGFPNDGGLFAGESDTFDNLRKRKPTSTGWCRICRVDCETVEGLDMHSQTREHQKMAMDMVINIKEKNGKKQKTSKDHSAREEGSKSRNVGFAGRGKKP